MKLSTIARTNIFVGIILILGFCLLSGIYCASFYADSMERLQFDITNKTNEIYAKIVPDFERAIKTSAEMSKEPFLLSYLSADEIYNIPNFKEAILKYLNGYFKYNNFDGVFLIIEKTMDYYSQDGYVDNILKNKKQHLWHDRSLAIEDDYDINIDYDKSTLANNEVSLFVNYKIRDWSGNVLGIIGVCIHLDDKIAELVKLEKNMQLSLTFVDAAGTIQLSSSDTALSKINFFSSSGNEIFADKLNELKNDYNKSNNELIKFNNNETDKFVIIKYLPNLSWFLVVESYMGDFYQKIKKNIITSAIIILAVLILVILFISNIIYKSESKAKKILEDQMRYFHDATRHMFNNIYEIDITNNCFARDSRLRQFVQISDMKNISYTESLQMLAQKAIKKEYQDDFIKTLSCKNIDIEFKKGTDHIGFECPVLVGDDYQWLKYDAYIFAVDSDKSIHMYLYCKNIDYEVKIMEEARIDDLTQCLNRGATAQCINEALEKNGDKQYIFFIMDIDNFKQANDTFGHGFGDYCLQKFSEGIRREFRKDDIIGRIGGDEFVVFLPYPSKAWARKKAEELVRTLDMYCQQEAARLHISASIGVAFYPEDGRNMTTLYRNADAALYSVKANGKNNYQFYAEASVCSLNSSIQVGQG